MLLGHIIEGFLIGLGLACLLGPAFFTLIQTSIDRGFKSAIMLALGVFFSDLFLVCISFLGAAKLFDNNASVSMVVSIIGGIILIGFGIYTFRKKHPMLMPAQPAELDPGIEEKLPRNITYILKGFFLNMANPATWFFWIGLVSFISAHNSIAGKLDYDAVIVFFSSALITVFLTDAFKSFIANQLKRFVTPMILHILNKTVGTFLALFGIYLIVKPLWPFVMKILGF